MALIFLLTSDLNHSFHAMIVRPGDDRALSNMNDVMGSGRAVAAANSSPAGVLTASGAEKRGYPDQLFGVSVDPHST